jgi:hypothetical protein
VKTLPILVALALGLPALAAADGPEAAVSCPRHAEHMKERAATPEAHAHGVDARGDAAMGFSHQATTHHFLLRKDGGAIEVTANHASDEASVAQIRDHLRHIANSFAKGDFTLPGVIHDQVPPGTEEMKARRSVLRYAFEEKETGGVVRMTTDDPAALRALHEFLRFQIEEHRTGDPTVP